MAAHGRKRITQALHSSRNFGSEETFLVPGIQLCPPGPAIPFTRRRRRFPIETAFAVTISKAQVLTLIPVAICLPSSAFPTASCTWNFLDPLHFSTSFV